MKTEGIPLKASQLEAVVTANLVAGKSVCITGPSGCGKTELGKLCIANATRILGCGQKLTVHPGTGEPTDAKGLPVMTSEGAEFSPYGWLRKLRDATEPTFVLVEDLGQAVPAMQAAMMQVMHGNNVNDVIISPHVRFLCTTNRKCDKGAGVNAILDPLKKRLLMLEFIPDLGEWQIWAAAHGIRKEVIAYLSLMREHFSQDAEGNDTLVSPHARGWERVSDQLNLNHSTDVQPAVFAGCVGPEAGPGFAGFLQVYDNLVMPASVWADPNTAQIPAQPDAMWALMTALANEVTNPTVGKLLRYLERLHDDHREHVMLCLHVMAARDPSLQANADYIKAAQGPLGRLMLGAK